MLIPDEYVADLSVRLTLYRRLADLEDQRSIDSFAAELVDRFGPMPVEAQQMLDIVAIKALCRRANVAKIDAGPKGAVISFRDDSFANPAGLISFIQKEGPAARVRPDMKVVFFEDWEDPEAASRARQKFSPGWWRSPNAPRLCSYFQPPPGRRP